MRWSRERRDHYARRNSYVQPKSPKPMDIPITSREEIRKNISRIAIDTGCGVESAIREYAKQINFTEESVREILTFKEEQTS